MISNIIKNKTATEKAMIKSSEIAKVKIGKFEKDDLSIEIIGDIKAIEINGCHGIEFFAKAWKNNKQLGFSKDGSVETERFRIYNPPILVDDENGNIIIEWVDNLTNEIRQRKLKENPQEAIKQSLAHVIELVGKENTKIVKGKIGNTTSTFYPVTGDANLSHNGTDFSTVHDASASSYAYSGSGDGASLLFYTSPTYYFARTFQNYDTSAIDSGDTIDSASLSLYGIVVNTLSRSYNIYGSTASDTIVVGDYDTYATTPLATAIADTAWNTSAYNSFNFVTAGKEHINKTGKTKVVIMDVTYDIGNTAPSTSGTQAKITFRQSSTDGTSQDPKLVVEHSSGDVTKDVSLSLSPDVSKKIIKDFETSLSLSPDVSKKIIKDFETSLSFSFEDILISRSYLHETSISLEANKITLVNKVFDSVLFISVSKATKFVKKNIEVFLTLSSSSFKIRFYEFNATLLLSTEKICKYIKKVLNSVLQLSGDASTGIEELILNASIKLGAAFREDVTTSVLWLRAAFCWMKNRGMATSMTLAPNIIILVKKLLETSFEVSGGKGKNIYCLIETTLIITIGKVAKMIKKIAQAAISISSGFVRHIINLIEATITMSPSITKSMKVFISSALTLTAEKFARFIRDVLQVTINMSSSVVRHTVNLIETTITMSPSIVKYIEKFISATFTLSASIYKFIKKTFESTLSLVEKAVKRMYALILITLSTSSGKPSVFTWKWHGDTDQGDDDTFRDDNISDDTRGGEGRRS